MKSVLAELERVWAEMPHLRLLQLIEGAVCLEAATDPFYVPDEVLYTALTKFKSRIDFEAEISCKPRD